PLDRAAASHCDCDTRRQILDCGLTGVLEGGSMPKVSLVELALVTTGAGRVKFIRVLEDARHRQVLRQAGAVYQFRHAELQDHLAKTYRRHTHSRQISKTSYQTDFPSNE
ncbi:MAG: hypothetical protein ACREQ5_39265, partial [Candidatus Dormibacteria bacterium]